MENRYSVSSIVSGSRKISPSGDVKIVPRLSTVMYPNLSTGDDQVVMAVEGDRLDTLSKEFYGDETFWFVIANANNLGKGTLNIPGGTLVRVPRYAEYDGIGALMRIYNQER
jgi:nucleoid-associated protein YgaU